MFPWWQEDLQLSAEICSLLGRSDLRAYYDMPHYCIHIMLGNTEWSSVLMPWNEDAKEKLRQRAWIMHNDQSANEMRKVKETNEKLFADSEKEQHQMFEDIGKSIAKWGCRDHDYYIMGGGSDK